MKADGRKGNHWLRLALLAGLAAALAGPAAAGFDEGKAAFEKQDYLTALQELRPLARTGNAPAQYLLGLMHADGLGVPADLLEAADWYLKAAEQGYAKARFSLAVAYYEGLGIQQSYREAARWFRLAAEQGDAAARFNLGMLYMAGNGVPQDYRESAKWLRLAAAQGIGESQNNLGYAFDHGQGVRHSDIAALALYTLAAENTASPTAARNRDQQLSHLTLDELDAAKALAKEMGKPGQFLPALDRFLEKLPP